MNFQVGLFSTVSQACSSAVTRLSSFLPGRTAILASDDHYVTLAPPSHLSPLDTVGWVSHLSRQGLSVETIAERINGTTHTAGINDMRLARKVVSVSMTQNEVIASPREALEAKERLRQKIKLFLESGRELDDTSLLRLLRAINSPEVRAFFAGLNVCFTLDVIPDDEFDDAIPKISLKDKTGYFESLRRKGLKDRLLIRGIPAVSVFDLDAEEKIIESVMDRLLTAMHEWEHWCHFTGSFAGKERRIAELLSRFEEQRLLLRIHKFDFNQQAAAKNQTLAQHFLAMEFRDGVSDPFSFLRRFFIG